MPAELVALSEGPNILLDKPILLLGRHEECDIQLGSRKVSRRHCCVAQVNDYFVVRDLGSTNGIRINGSRVVEGSLHPGDELTIGNQRYQLQWNSKVEPPQPPVAKLVEPDPNLESCDEPVALPEPVPVMPVPGFGVLRGPPPPLMPDDLKMAPLNGDNRVQK